MRNRYSSRLDEIAGRLEESGNIKLAYAVDKLAEELEAFYDDPNIPGAEDEDDYGRPIRKPLKVNPYGIGNPPKSTLKKEYADRDDYRPRGVSTLY